MFCKPEEIPILPPALSHFQKLHCLHLHRQQMTEITELFIIINKLPKQTIRHYFFQSMCFHVLICSLTLYMKVSTTPFGCNAPK